MSKGRDFQKRILVGTNQTGKTYFALHEIAAPTYQTDRSKIILFVSSTYDDETMINAIPKDAQLNSFKQLKGVKRGIFQFWDDDVYEEEGKYGIFKGLYNLAKSGELRNGAFIFDDATAYFPNGKVDNLTGHFLQKYRHWELDVYYMFHSISDVPKTLWKKIHGTYLKKTLEGSYDLRYFSKDRCMMNAEAFYAAYIRLQGVSFVKKPDRYSTIYIPTGL